MFSKFFSSFALLASALSFSSISRADDITILADPWCPYTCDASGANKGVFIEMAEKALPNHKIIYKNEGWARALELVKEGKESAVAGAGGNDAKDFITSVSGEAAMENCFYAPKGSTWKYTGLDSIKTINLGVINGYAYEPKLDEYLASKPKNVDIYSGADNGAAINVKKLAAKRLEAYLDDKNVIAYTAKQEGVSDKIQDAGCLGPDTGYIAFSKKNPKSAVYAKELEEGVKKLKASGEYQKIMAKYGL